MTQLSQVCAPTARRFASRPSTSALRRSRKRIRWFYPVIKAKDGTVIDGNHRLAADPNWKAVTLADMDTDEKKALARIACNFVRREVSQAEKREMLGNLAKMGWDAKKIAEETGIPLRTVYEYLGRFKPLSQRPRVWAGKIREGSGWAHSGPCERPINQFYPNQLDFPPLRAGTQSGIAPSKSGA